MSFARGSLFDNVKVVPVLASGAGTTTRNTEVIDTKGFGRVAIVVHFSAIAGDLTSLKLQHSDAVTNETTLNGGADIAGSATAVLAAGAKCRIYDVAPNKRYLQLNVVKDTGSTTESVTAYLYQAKSKPVGFALGSSVVGEGTDVGAVAKVLNNPVSGTA